MALFAAPALADRPFETAMGGLNQPWNVAIGTGDYVWVTDGGQQGSPGSKGLYKYDPVPSQTLLGAPSTASAFSGILNLTAAVDNESGEVFVAQSNGRAVYIFTPPGPDNPCKAGEPVCYTHAWTKINSSSGSHIHIAIDNTDTYSGGRIYLSLSAPENDIEALDAKQRPVDFPAEASYIEDNKLTGTPSGKFGHVEEVGVDHVGNIYVTDVEKKVVDEFDSTGTFLRALPAPEARESYNEPGAGGAGVDPTNGNILITGWTQEGFEFTPRLREYDENGNLLDVIEADADAYFLPVASPAVNSAGYAYIPTLGSTVDIFGPKPVVPEVQYAAVANPTLNSATLRATVDPAGGGPITECEFQYGTAEPVSEATYTTAVDCSPDPGASPPGSNFSSPADVSAAISSLTTGTAYHYRVVVHNANGVKYGSDRVYTPQAVLGLRTDPATDVTESAATLQGAFVGNGSDTHYYFEWGRTPAYGQTTAPAPGLPAGSPSGEEALEGPLTGLSPFSTYHYRVVASNGGTVSHGEDQMFTTTPGIPTGRKPAATGVHADRAVLHGEVNPNGAPTTAHFEYVTDAEYQSTGWANAQSAPTADVEVGMSKKFQSVSAQLTGLQAGTIYRYRIVGENEMGEGDSVRTFKTFPFIPSINDSCPNAHARQQTGAALLLDCRAYELVSASEMGGYDVESSLVAGQAPFGGYPEAEDGAGEPRVLYGVHYGGIPGTGNVTNNGVDPYVATRTPTGWGTRYEGIPADGTPSTKPFASSLLEADAQLDAFVFGGPEICSPCFADGKRGMPLREPSGELVQGMAGTLDPGPGAEPDGFVGRHFSAGGSHLVFASSAQFEPDGNNNGDVSVYDRNLTTGVTRVVSKTPAGATMTGPGIGELDISGDGSRVLVGQMLGQEGNARRWHLFMHVGDSDGTIDLTPGSVAGALYDGMTRDGSKVFFTTTDRLLAADEDDSADIYEADVSPSGSNLRLVSTGSGGTGNADDCNPAANTFHEHWNDPGTAETCGVVAVGGGGGVAAGDGTIYFLSPELLDESGDGVEGAPNLYVARPGQAPSFVATLESSANAPLPPSSHPFVRAFGSFANPAGIAIDHSNGDTYVFDIGNGLGGETTYIYKFDATGKPILNFGESGKLAIAGAIGVARLPTQIAVDNNPASNSYRDLYVPDLSDGIVKKYAPSGAHLSDITGLAFPTGVAVNPTNSDVYIASYFGSISIYEENGTPVSSFAPSESPAPTAVAVNAGGDVYVSNGGGPQAAKGTTEIYSAAGTHLGQLTDNPSLSVAIDPADGHIYVDGGDRISEFDSSGEPTGSPAGVGRISGSFSFGVDSGSLRVSNPSNGNALSFGPAVVPFDPNTDNPLVIDSVDAPGTRRSGDLQVNPSGEQAVFTSTLPLTGYDNDAHGQVFRYSSALDRLDCASCNPTGEQSSGDATLAPDGLDLSADGRVFFNSTEGLVDRDLNGNEDAYEWIPDGFAFAHGSPECGEEAGCIELISTGSSPYPSRLLSISSDGTDAYFFTRDKLSEHDANGNSVKIYDARQLGGFPFVPAPIQCKASDECHGAGTEPPPPTDIKTVGNSPGGNEPAQRCRRNFVRRHGKCVRKPKHRHHHHRSRHRHRGHGHG